MFCTRPLARKYCRPAVCLSSCLLSLYPIANKLTANKSASSQMPFQNTVSQQQRERELEAIQNAFAASFTSLDSFGSLSDSEFQQLDAPGQPKESSFEGKKASFQWDSGSDDFDDTLEDELMWLHTDGQHRELSAGGKSQPLRSSRQSSWNRSRSKKQKTSPHRNSSLFSSSSQLSGLRNSQILSQLHNLSQTEKQSQKHSSQRLSQPLSQKLSQKALQQLDTSDKENQAGTKVSSFQRRHDAGDIESLDSLSDTFEDDDFWNNNDIFNKKGSTSSTSTAPKAAPDNSAVKLRAETDLEAGLFEGAELEAKADALFSRSKTPSQIELSEPKKERIANVLIEKQDFQKAPIDDKNKIQTPQQPAQKLGNDDFDAFSDYSFATQSDLEGETDMIRKSIQASNAEFKTPQRVKQKSVTEATQQNTPGLRNQSTFYSSDPTSPEDHFYRTTEKRFVINRDENRSPIANSGTINVTANYNIISFESPEIILKNKHVPIIAPSPLQITQNRRPSVDAGITKSPTQSRRQVSTLSKLAVPTLAALEIVLSEEQLKVLKVIELGHNLFYTGSAGTGKSVLLRHAIKALKEKYPAGEVAVTASTGLAACNIGGVTLHSFAGIGLGEGKVQQLVKKIKRSKKSLNNWKKTKVLFIDEVSMVDGQLLDKLNEIAKTLRRSEEPFGGIQVIFCGDFYQLPPVVKKSFDNRGNEDLSKAHFAFESAAWKETIKIMVILTKVFRQQGDLEFIDMLNEMRNGNLSDRTIHNFVSLRRPLPTDDGIEPAELFSTRYEVDRANSRRLGLLRGDEFVFNAIDGGSLPDIDAREKILSNFLAPKQLVLKKGAQVMMIKNIDDTLVNGTLGKVIDFVDPDTYCFYKQMEQEVNDPYNVENESPEVLLKRLEKKADQAANSKSNKTYTTAKANQKPKDLLEIHSDDEDYSTRYGNELDESVFDFFKHVETDESMDPIQAENINRKKQLINQLYGASKKKRSPLVRFLTPEGTTRDVLVCPETWDIEDEFGTPIVSRTQVPLMLAWAISIHKSQGQTLLKARVDLRKVFEKGQAYVALSRVTARKGLQVLNFIPSKVMTHLSVTDFYNTLMSADTALQKAKEIESNPAFMIKKFFKVDAPTIRESFGVKAKGGNGAGGRKKFQYPKRGRGRGNLAAA